MRISDWSSDVCSSDLITVNKNAIPNDPEKPFVTSGVRLGTPAMTTRGFKEAEAELTGHLIADVLDNPRNETAIADVRARVNEQTGRASGRERVCQYVEI